MAQHDACRLCKRACRPREPSAGGRPADRAAAVWHTGAWRRLDWRRHLHADQGERLLRCPRVCSLVGHLLESLQHMRWQSHHPLYEDCLAMTGDLHQQLPPLHALPVAWCLQQVAPSAGPARHMPGPGKQAGKSQVTGLMRRLLWDAQTIVNGNVSLAGHRPDVEGVWGAQTIVNGNVSLAGHRPDAEGVWGVQTIVNGNVSLAGHWPHAEVGVGCAEHCERQREPSRSSSECRGCCGMRRPL